MNPTEYEANASRSLLVYLTPLVTTTWTVPDDSRFNADSVQSFIRVSATCGGDVTTGWHPSTDGTATRATILEMLVVCECYYRETSAAEVRSTDSAGTLAGQVRSALRAPLHVPILDYLSDPQAPAATEAQLQFSYPSTTSAPPVINGWQRRIVTTRAFWIARTETTT
jgi:hypothetical protein